MPELSEEQYERVALILSELEPLVDDLNDVPANFVRDQIERNKKFGPSMFVSPKQLQWLTRLHEEHVGTAELPDTNGPDLDDPRFSGESDDVPF